MPARNDVSDGDMTSQPPNACDSDCKECSEPVEQPTAGTRPTCGDDRYLRVRLVEQAEREQELVEQSAATIRELTDAVTELDTQLEDAIERVSVLAVRLDRRDRKLAARDELIDRLADALNDSLYWVDHVRTSHDDLGAAEQMRDTNDLLAEVRALRGEA